MKHLQKFYKKGVKVLIIILIGFLSGALGSFVTLQLYQKQGNQATNNNSGTVTQTSYKNENSTTQAVNKVKDAVVSIITYSSSSSRQSSVFNADDTNSDSDNQQIASEGSGVIYKKDDKDAYLVTNTHVINGASKVDIRLADGTKVPGEIVGSDTFSDIAVVKISSEKVTTVAEWMSKEYACSYADALHPFLAPGQKVKVTRKDTESPWQLVCEKSGPVDERWVELTEKAADFTPAANASKQRSVLEALAQGAMRLSELSATIPGARSAVTALQKKGIVEVRTQRQIRGSQEGLGTTLSSGVAPRPQQLTEGQESALAAIEAAQNVAQGDVVLIDGVTGSGKTEVYLSAIEKTLAAGKGAVVLVPEISLTAQTVGRFRSRFGEQVAVLHSKLSLGERFDQWDLIRQGRARVVVGARSALFAPIQNPGLYIIDEEHEASYKQDSLPRYHAREVAAQMACLRGAALVLGSATPSLESLYRTAQGSWRDTNWTRVAMTERPGVAVLPQVQVVDMASQFKNGGTFCLKR